MASGRPTLPPAELPIRDAATIVLVRRTAAGPQVLMGQRGPAVVAVASRFKWLDFLDQGWEQYFNTHVTSSRMGHWTEAPSVGSRQQAAPYELGTQRDVVYIGYSPTTGAFFHGAIPRTCCVEIDRQSRRMNHRRPVMPGKRSSLRSR